MKTRSLFFQKLLKSVNGWLPFQRPTRQNNLAVQTLDAHRFKLWLCSSLNVSGSQSRDLIHQSLFSRAGMLMGNRLHSRVMEDLGLNPNTRLLVSYLTLTLSNNMITDTITPNHELKQHTSVTATCVDYYPPASLSCLNHNSSLLRRGFKQYLTSLPTQS